MLAFPAAAQLSSPDCGNDDDDESNTVCDGGRSVSGTRIAQRGDCIKGGAKAGGVVPGVLLLVIGLDGVVHGGKDLDSLSLSLVIGELRWNMEDDY